MSPLRIRWLQPTDPPEAFPAPEQALTDPDGLLAAGGDLSPERLEYAYRRGIFPWYNPGDPILWWSPDPRMVLFPAELHVSRSLARTLRRADFEISCDTAFAEVISGCASPRGGVEGTWITPAMNAAYNRLHELGLAHSIEIWMDGELAGGLYGVALGTVFFGESMFSRRSDASKIALTYAARRFGQYPAALIDCQMYSRHLVSMGAREISRPDFLTLLDAACTAPSTPDTGWTRVRAAPDAAEREWLSTGHQPLFGSR